MIPTIHDLTDNEREDLKRHIVAGIRAKQKYLSENFESLPHWQRAWNRQQAILTAVNTGSITVS